VRFAEKVQASIRLGFSPRRMYVPLIVPFSLPDLIATSPASAMPRATSRRPQSPPAQGNLPS
jgi:hypothetical protein